MSGGHIDFAAARRGLERSRRQLRRSLEPDAKAVDAAYRRRAERLARRVDDGDRVPALEVLVVRLGPERCGLPLARLAEVMAVRAVTPVPGAPPEVAGVVNLRGDIRPVLDIAGAFGGAGGAGAEAGIVFLRRNGGEVGLRVDAVETVAAVGTNDLAPIDEGETALPLRFARGLTADGLVVLDVDAILALIADTEGRDGPRGEDT